MANCRSMKTKNLKAKLISYLLVDSLTSRVSTKTNKEIAQELGCESQDVQWWLNVLMIDKQIHVWEEEGIRKISMFEGR